MTIEHEAQALSAACTIRLLIIGDELLSGKRQDRHLSKVIELLAVRGLALDGAEFLPDDESRIAEAVARGLAGGAVLLCCGGIGATPDDLTRQAVGRALHRPIQRHAEAENLIIAEYGERATPNRLLMADFPAGAEIIPNPVNRVAGFSIDNCYCVPGFPEMAWPMLEWVLDTRLASMHREDPPVEFRLRVTGTSGEGDLLQLMQGVIEAHPGIKFSSLPSRGNGERKRHIEFGFKGPRAEAQAACGWFRQHLLVYSTQSSEMAVEPLLVEELASR